MISIDKNTIMMVLGGLIREPSILGELDKYDIRPEDFTSRFEVDILRAIHSLFNSGSKKITPLDIENTFSTDPVAYQRFKNNNGIEYCQDCYDFAEEGNFKYYYDKLKKLNLLKTLQRKGYRVDKFYIEDLTDSKAVEVNSNFDNVTMSDIIEYYKKDLSVVEGKFNVTGEVETEYASDGIEEFFEELSIENEMGLPIQGDILNFMIGGAVPGTLTIRSAASGAGKTRNSVGDACNLAYPFKYTKGKGWEKTGNNEKVLFIMTEQDFSEVRKMILAWISGISEDKIKYKLLTPEEDAIIHQTLSIMKKYKGNLILVKMPNPTITLLKTKIREQVTLHDIKYCFYDYIFICPSILKEFNNFKLRNDEVLMMVAQALKDLAVELNIAVFTSTQVNANIKNSSSIRDEGTMQGGRATINKADNGMILARINKDEMELLETEHLLEKVSIIPNMVTDIFKVRSGAYTNVRIWSYIDLGTLKRKDLFVTDAMFNVINIENYVSFEIQPEEEQLKDYKNLIEGVLIE